MGAANGYALSWVVVASVIFMLAFTTMAARLGVMASESPGNMLTKSVGRWLAILIGVSIFFIASAFQFGNNLGVHTAFNAYVKFEYIVVLFNAAAIAFLFCFKNLYRALEKLMMGFVGLMLLAFAANLFFAKPKIGEWGKALYPAEWGRLILRFLGWWGRRLSSLRPISKFICAPKGCREGGFVESLVDSRVGAVIMASITLMIMGTAASVLRGKELADAGAVAQQLQPLFGDSGKALFCLGLFSAAYSSFLINSMIGGFVLADGLGLGSEPDDPWTRRMTAAVLITGMLVALYVIRTGVKPVGAIVMAQAVTVIAAPLMAGVLLWLCNRKEYMGEHRNGPLLNVCGWRGLSGSLGHGLEHGVQQGMAKVSDGWGNFRLSAVWLCGKGGDR